jgi:hypothetical protein
MCKKFINYFLVDFNKNYFSLYLSTTNCLQNAFEDKRFSIMHAYMLLCIFLDIMLWLFILDCFERLDCPECDTCDYNECLNENFNQGKCHFIVPIFFLCMYFIFRIDA